ncbi:undecaprenyl/decaprenyl-phosphate alpha-N-acetylglucosaminyl 1-phosphate transferase [Microbispora sp. NEAU-D428]|uniref:glycosyltransferase family 4 protein n=1 Tax=Microbispora sitophila TaxID=2771537 RepID=UPI0018660770|nr:MraY family glycosyltransferase [Microbispora sitophila]MBE3013293.1 undecaprenyl/decaprenyl-phosphate alpha-N-acetylglucosaminyl 1-phosphate transferase [Microbispora sitophila]
MLTAALTPVLRRLALRWGFMDRPGGHKSHERATPYLGGVAIMLGTVVPSVALISPTDERFIGIVIGAVIVTLLGLIDDLSPLPQLTRLAVEFLAAGGVVLTGVHASVTGTWLDGPITVLWIVVVTNSFNLLDNMDGALAAVTVVTAAILAGAAFVSAQPAIGLILATLPLACLGFLPYNWAPAKIFMGDAGSLFVGFVLTCSAALLITGHDTGTAIAGLLLPTFVATVDTGVVLLSRRRAGRPMMRGGTDHLSHRLRRLGLSTRLTALTLAALAAVTGVLDLVMMLGWIPPLGAAIVGLTAACVLIGLPQRVRVYPPVRAQKSLHVRRK